MRELTLDELCDVAGGDTIDSPDWQNLPTPRPNDGQDPQPVRALPWFPPENYVRHH